MSSREVTSPDALLGREIGGYELKRVIGTGNTGTTYRAEHTLIKSHIAFKILKSSFGSDNVTKERFMKGARAASLIAHDNIVKVFAADAANDGRFYVVMELLDGGALGEYVAGPTSLTAVAPLVLQVMDALSAAHEAGVVHGDVRAENIFVTRGATRVVPKLLDFGIAHLRDPSLQLHPTADIHALGLVLLWIATGRKISTKDLPAPIPSSLNPSLPKSYDAVLLRALSEKPENRYPTMRDFAAGFELAVAIASESPETAQSNLRAPKRNLAETFDRVSFALPKPDSGRKAALEVHLRIGSLDGFRKIYTMDILHHGMFIGTEEALPPTQTLIDVVIVSPDQSINVRLAGRVVRCVTAADAAAFGGKRGMAIQLLDLDMLKRAQLERALHGESTTETARSSGANKNARAMKAIERFGGPGKSPYQLLQIVPASSAAEIRAAVQNARSDCDPAMIGPTPDDQAAALARIRDQIDRAAALLLDPRTRAAHDAASGNYLGIAQALAAGLSMEELTQLRTQYLSTRWEAPATAKALVKEALLAEFNDNLNDARIHLERALAVDPLDLETHNRYWALRRR